jgi:hypothetical protein
MYYEVIETVMLADLHSLKLLLNVLLKSVDKKFFCTEGLFYPRVFQTILLFNLSLKKLFWSGYSAKKLLNSCGAGHCKM